MQFWASEGAIIEEVINEQVINDRGVFAFRHLFLLCGSAFFRKIEQRSNNQRFEGNPWGFETFWELIWLFVRYDYNFVGRGTDITKMKFEYRSQEMIK